MSKKVKPLVLRAGGLAKNLASCRRERRLSQAALAQLAGTSQTGISKIERGEIENVGLQALQRLAYALNVNVPQLIAAGATTAPETNRALSSDEAALLTRFASLAPTWKSFVMDAADFARYQQQKGDARRAEARRKRRIARDKPPSETDPSKRVEGLQEEQPRADDSKFLNALRRSHASKPPDVKGGGHQDDGE